MTIAHINEISDTHLTNINSLHRMFICFDDHWRAKTLRVDLLNIYRRRIIMILKGLLLLHLDLPEPCRVLAYGFYTLFSRALVLYPILDSTCLG